MKFFLAKLPNGEKSQECDNVVIIIECDFCSVSCNTRPATIMTSIHFRTRVMITTSPVHWRQTKAMPIIINSTYRVPIYTK